MLKDTELDTLARAVAALGDEDAGRLDEAVRERRRAKAEAEAERIAKLRAMDDHAVIDEAIRESVEYPERWESDVALKVLRDAGFVRQPAEPTVTFLFPWDGENAVTVSGSKDDLDLLQVILAARISDLRSSKGA
ncbi:hypothetical protein NS228_05000 [Methylobacterium indicum]|uniref:hypothetical protein n=1 Tax=Methylobacterium indicum TaxID=1775910 RepID=UPI000734C841|nr:hypothetical protein [Methylobacterium indicum]KTS39508.1 hypothetical protein NS229_00065 [Methylobacterium indicum]KTS41744.1 hypothetical protein NS228_05000 [Methylobacterium indicum]KTS53518.1 hypothetical protein NS230_05455 [Methylobacterium indicum]